MNRFNCAPCVLVMLGMAATCHAGEFSAGAGFDYSSGKYGGTDRTTITNVPMHAKYESGPLTLKISTSWITISGTGVIIPSGIGGIGGIGGSGGDSGSGGGSVGTFGCAADNRSGARKPEDNGPCAATGAKAGAAIRRTEQGLGDIVAAATYNVMNNPKGLRVDVTGKIKFATASATRGLGSGKTDYAMQSEAEYAIGKGYINGGVGYKWLGDPNGIDLKNVVYGTVGGGVKLSDKTTVGVSYDYANAARSGGVAVQEMSVYASRRLTDKLKLNGSLYKGLSSSTPDWGAGVGLGYYF